MNKENTDDKNISAAVAEILCQTKLGDVLRSTLWAIVHNRGQQRIKAIVDILIDLPTSVGRDLGWSDPGINTQHASKIIQATVTSFTDYRDKILFLQTIMQLHGKYSRELQLTAAILAFDHWDVGNPEFPKLVEIFGQLFLGASSVTVEDLARYYHYEGNTGAVKVIKFFSEKCQLVAWGQPKNAVILAALDKVQVMVRTERHTRPSFGDHVFKIQKPDLVLSVIISELSHKRVSSLSPYSMIDFLCEDIRK